MSRAAGRAALTLAVLAAVLVVASLGGGAAAPAAPHARAAGDVATIQRLLAARLATDRVTVRRLACIESGRRYGATAIVRCNANVDAPHVEVYCAVLRNRRLVTNHERPAIPCGHDDRGAPPPVIVSAPS